MSSTTQPSSGAPRRALALTLALALALALAAVAPSDAAPALKCVRCPKGSKWVRGKCVKKLWCGKHHTDDGDSCYKRFGKAGKLPEVECQPGDDRSFDMCYRSCKGGYFNDYETCYHKGNGMDLYFRPPVAPKRRYCKDKGYWLVDDYCRPACPKGYKWRYHSCRVNFCPPGTVNRGEKCMKPVVPCIRGAPRKVQPRKQRPHWPKRQ